MIKRKDWVVYELNRKTQNLEDIFRELTNEKTNI